MKRDCQLYFNDIIESVEKIQQYIKGITEEKFYKDFKTQDAVIRRLEIIGEATKHITQDIREKFPKVPWRKMSALRNVLIHEYLTVSLKRIWKVINESLPELQTELKKLKL